jgi:hypothetical protein
VLQRRTSLPHFSVTTVDGALFRYADVWQAKCLVLVVLPAETTDPDRSYAEALAAGLELSNPSGQHTALVVTRDPVPGDDRPLALVADKWGEIHHVTHADDIDGLPSPGELGQWLLYVRSRCG